MSLQTGIHGAFRFILRRGHAFHGQKMPVSVDPGAKSDSWFTVHQRVTAVLEGSPFEIPWAVQPSF